MTGHGYVVDASVAVKWLVDEAGSDRALDLRHENLIAPELVRIEAANVLRSLAAREAISEDVAISRFAFFQNAPVTIVGHDDALERRALELALRFRHPVYDCIYLALAERTDRTLITADDRFVRRISETHETGSVLPLDRYAPFAERR